MAGRTAGKVGRGKHKAARTTRAPKGKGKGKAAASGSKPENANDRLMREGRKLARIAALRKQQQKVDVGRKHPRGRRDKERGEKWVRGTGSSCGGPGPT